jgi:hypothetical protein
VLQEQETVRRCGTAAAAAAARCGWDEGCKLGIDKPVLRIPGALIRSEAIGPVVQKNGRAGEGGKGIEGGREAGS